MPKKQKLNKQDIFEQKLIKNIKEVQHPIRSAIIISLILLLLCVAFSIIIIFINDNSILWNINLGFTLMMVVAIIWTMLKFGVLEGPRLKFLNWRNKKIISNLELKKDLEISLEEFRNINQKKSWIGILLLFSIGLIGFLITIIIIYN